MNHKSRGMKLRTAALATLLSMASQAGFAQEADSVPEYVPGEFLVKLKTRPGAIETMSSNQQLGLALHAYVKNRIASANIVVVKRASMETPDSAVSELEQNPLVEYAEPNYIYRINKTPTQGSYGKLWGLNNIGQEDPGSEDFPSQTGVKGVDIGAEKAWDITTGSDKVLVAVIDTGIDYTHPDLIQNAWTNPGETGTDASGKNKQSNGIDDDSNGYIDDVHGFNFSDSKNPTNDPMDDHGHGSHCSGTIGGFGTGGKGIVGVNWKVKIAGVKFLDANGSGSLEGAVQAIDYATKIGAKIMSNSWGGGGTSKALNEAVLRTNKAGALFVAAAGNSGVNIDKSPSYPASIKSLNILAVAAIDNQGGLASFSNYGVKTVSLGAPGVNVYSSIKGGTYDSWSGTSMATPHVSGVAALVLAKEPNLTSLELKQRLVSTTKALTSLSGKVVSGGMVNAFNALTKNTTEAEQ